MNKSDSLSADSPDVTAEAAAWLAQLETGQLSKEDMAAFREWIGRSPRHYSEIHRLAQVSLDVNVLAGMAGPLRRAAGRRDVVRLAPRGRRTGWGAAAGAVFGAVCFLLVSFMGTQESSFAPVELSQPIVVVTDIGETEELALEDGSRLKLNTNSQVEVEFRPEERRIYLEKGEAFFEVAPDPDRPFTVYAGEQSVTAIGTAFSVRWTDEEFVVTVSEGKVAYGQGAGGRSSGLGEKGRIPAERSADTPHVSAMLAAGQRLERLPTQQEAIVAELPQTVLSRELAWRSGFLDFDDMALKDVVREMQRYTPQEILIEDEGLADLRFGGVFRIGQTEAFFDALEMSFGVIVDRESDGKLILRSTD